MVLRIQSKALASAVAQQPIASTGPGPTAKSRGTVAPIPDAPARECKAIGGASKNFGTDASGKTPTQLWAERKAREKGLSITPDFAPQRPLRNDETGC